MVRTPREVLDSLYQKAISNEFITAAFEQGRIGLLFSGLAAEIQNWERIVENFMLQFNLVTATDEKAIEFLAAPLYLRHPASYSKVILTFLREEGMESVGDIFIPANTIVETPGSDPIQYKTVNETYLYEGQNETKVLAMSVDTGSNTHVWAEELNIIVSNIPYTEVINEEDSWAGKDAETIDEVKQRAMIARYDLEHGTPLAIQNGIMDYGLKYYEFNMVEYAFGYGSLGVWVDTTIDEVIEEVTDIIQREKAAGTYFICEKATPFNVPFSVVVNLALNKDILPNQRDALVADIDYYLRLFITQSGVGTDFNIQRAEHFIIEELIEKWDIYNLDIIPGIMDDLQDEDGNIEIEQEYVIKPTSISVTVEV